MHKTSKNENGSKCTCFVYQLGPANLYFTRTRQKNRQQDNQSSPTTKKKEYKQFKQLRDHNVIQVAKEKKCHQGHDARDYEQCDPLPVLHQRI